MIYDIKCIINQMHDKQAVVQYPKDPWLYDIFTYVNG